MTQCATCRYSRPAISDEEPILECWRYPPIMFIDEDDILSVRPTVAESDTCGEYAV